MQDKAFWQSIIDTEFAIPEGHSIVELTDELFDYLSSTDPVLRDTFGYTILLVSRKARN